MSLISELKRRNVLRVAAGYVVTAWLIIQVAETVMPIYGFSDAAIRYVITGLAVGLLPVLVLAWAFEWTPEGLKLDSQVDRSDSIARHGGRGFDRGVMVLLAIAIGYFAFDKFVLSESREAAIAEAAREAGRSEAVVEAYGDRSIAVLAFADMSPNGDQEYMSDGIAEEILNLLAKVPDLRVISRSSAFAFKNTTLQIPEIAEQLNAAFVLEGSVRKAGDQLRITAQLIEAGSDTHRWSETYDRKLENVFDIQDDIAAQVVEQLTSTLLGEAPRSQRMDEEAYTLVLQARYLWWRRSEGDEEQALALFEQAVEIDPTYAPAWVGLVSPTLVAVQQGRLEREAGVARANEAIQKALALDPSNAEAYVRLGQVMSFNPETSVDSPKQYEKAYELDPNNPLVLGTMALQASRQGRVDDSIAFIDRAAAVDPLGAIWPGNKASTLINFRRPDEAEVAARRAFELNGNGDFLNQRMVDIHILRGEFTQALETLDQMPSEAFNLARRAIALYGAGEVEASDEMLAGFKQLDIPEATFALAQAYAMRGDNDLAFDYLEQVRDDLFPTILVYDAYARALIDDPRWKPWVDSLDWPWDYEY